MTRQITTTGQIILIILFAARGLFFVSPPALSENQSAVIINELMWMGSSASSSDEWIELKNLTDSPVDLSGWYMTKLSGGSETTMLILPDNQSIASNDYYLISNYSADSANSVLDIQPDLVDTSVSLVNSGLQIKLYTSEHVLIDAADDGVGRPLAGEYESGQTWKSMERNWAYGDGMLETSWHTAEISYNFDDGTSELGTPRWSNTDPNYPPTATAG